MADARGDRGSAAGDLDRSAEAARAAITVAERSGNPVVVAESEFAIGLGHFGALEPVDAIAHYERSIAAARAGGDEWIVAWGMGWLVLTNVIAGHIKRSIIDAETTIEHCRRTHHWAEHGLVTAGAAAAQLSAGDLAGAEKSAATAAIASHARSLVPVHPRPRLADPCVHPGAQAQSCWRTTITDDWAAASVSRAARFGLLIDALTLPAERFEAAVDLARYLPSARTPMHAFSAGGLAVDVEVGARLGDGVLLELALERLNTLHSQAVVLLLPMGASVDRLQRDGPLRTGRDRTGDGCPRHGRRRPSAPWRHRRSAALRRRAVHRGGLGRYHQHRARGRGAGRRIGAAVTVESAVTGSAKRCRT